MFDKLTDYIKSIEVNTISDERLMILNALLDYIQEKVDTGGIISLNFICTHNSRRSHLSQIWAQAMAERFHFNQINCYSGGTMSTAVYPMVLEVLEEAGFESTQLFGGSNPVSALRFSSDNHPIISFSKPYDHPFNPSGGFAAVMTCSDADENCPIISGAKKRISLNYEDPKAFDNTPEEHQKYSERSRQIATEMFYIFSKIK